MRPATIVASFILTVASTSAVPPLLGAGVAIGEILGQLRGETECQTTAESGIIDDCEKVIGLLNSTLATTRLPRKKNGEFDKHPIGTCQVQIHYKGDWADSCVSTWKAMIIPLNIMMNKCKDETNVGAFVEIGGDSCPATLDIVRADRPTAAS